MALADGIPGLESTHSCNGYVFNDLTAEPKVWLNRITGLHSLAEIDDQRLDNGGRDWETPLPTPRKGKTIVFEGEIQSRTLAGLRQNARAMRGALRERSAEQMFLAGTAPGWWYRARIMQLDQDDEWIVGVRDVRPYRRRFTFGLRMSDGRFFYNEDESISGTSTQHVAMTNAGIADSPPVFTIQVAAANSVIDIFNHTLGRDLYFHTVPAGTMTVDFHNRSVSVGGVDIGGHLATDGTSWWDEGVPDLIPGENIVSVTGAPWTMHWYHADE